MSYVQLSEEGFQVVHPVGLWSQFSRFVTVLLTYSDMASKLLEFTFTWVGPLRGGAAGKLACISRLAVSTTLHRVEFKEQLNSIGEAFAIVPFAGMMRSPPSESRASVWPLQLRVSCSSLSQLAGVRLLVYI